MNPNIKDIYNPKERLLSADDIENWNESKSERENRKLKHLQKSFFPYAEALLTDVVNKNKNHGMPSN